MTENRKTITRGMCFHPNKDTHDALSIEPSELVFRDTEVGKTY